MAKTGLLGRVTAFFVKRVRKRKIVEVRGIYQTLRTRNTENLSGQNPDAHPKITVRGPDPGSRALIRGRSVK